MNEVLSRRRFSNRRLILPVTAALLIVVAAAAGLTSCGGDAPQSVSRAEGSTISAAGTSGSVTSATTQMTTPAAVDPHALGDSVGTLWTEAIQKLVDLLKQKPAVEDVRDQVERLKEEYVAKFVELGRKWDALDATGKAQAGASTSRVLDSAADQSWFVSYKTIYGVYSSGDQDFATLLASFNILTQYADFDLLKQQAPEEAARLGIR